jgi:hypothetical protein
MNDGSVSGAQEATFDAPTIRAVRKPSARLAFVRAVRDGGLAATEPDWIEWKSQADLRDKQLPPWNIHDPREVPIPRSELRVVLTVACPVTAGE